MNFLLILISTMLVYLSSRSLITIWKNKRDLGEILVSGYGGLKNADRSQLLITLTCLVIWGISIYRFGTPFISSPYMLVLAIAMVIFFMISLIQINVVPGFYDKYVATGSMIFAYKDITRYEVAPHKKRKGFSYVYINGRPGLLSSGIRVLVQDSDIPEVKRILKKRVK
ncbi:MAG: hypothetical protein J5822_03490 [Eubacteriaceae bacterium]|nr:hypothetical protein [Eubacteriaceae bacterium]